MIYKQQYNVIVPVKQLELVFIQIEAPPPQKKKKKKKEEEKLCQ